MTRRPYKSTTLRMLVHFVWVRGTCETSQVLLARVPGVFFRGVLPFLPHLPVGPSHMKGTFYGAKIVQSLVMSTASV